MEKEKLDWKLEEEQQTDEKQDQHMKESKIDKIALADFILSKLPKEMLDMLEKGEKAETLLIQWENKMLKKENEALKSRLEKAASNPLKLAGQGGEGEKDPFMAGFMQAMTNY